MLASARAALHSTKSSSWARTFIGAAFPHGGAGKPVRRTSFTLLLTHLLVRLLPAVPRPPDQDHADEHRERHEVDQLDEPVAGVGEEEHPYPFRAAESSHRPRQVKQTISTSMTIWE